MNSKDETPRLELLACVVCNSWVFGRSRSLREGISVGEERWRLSFRRYSRSRGFYVWQDIQVHHMYNTSPCQSKSFSI